MSKEFNRVIENEFAKRIPEMGLVPDKPVGPIAWPGERCFRTAGSATVAWLCIFPDYKGLNEFHVEIAWSHLGIYPSSCSTRPSPLASPPECFSAHAEGFLRLANLCTPPRTAWGAESLAERLAKLSREEAVALGVPLVAAATQAIAAVGLPLLSLALGSRQKFLQTRAA